MATIVRDKKTKQEYVLLGVGLGAFANLNSWGTLKKGEFPMLAVSDHFGNIGWLYSDDCEVLSVDNQTPKEHLDKYLS